MNLNVLRYVIEVEKSRSITGAAKQLFISQPNLSRDIRELEDEIGFSIFTRSSRGSGSHGPGKRISAARQKGRAAVPGAGAFLHKRGTWKPLPADLCAEGRVYPYGLCLLSYKTRKRTDAVRGLSGDRDNGRHPGRLPAQRFPRHHPVF